MWSFAKLESASEKVGKKFFYIIQGTTLNITLSLEYIFCQIRTLSDLQGAAALQAADPSLQVKAD